MRCMNLEPVIQGLVYRVQSEKKNKCCILVCNMELVTVLMNQFAGQGERQTHKTDLRTQSGEERGGELREWH